MSFTSRPPVGQQAVLDALRLVRSQNVGPVTFRNLVDMYGSPAVALEHLPELSRRGGRKKPVRIADKSFVARELDQATRLGMQAIAVTGDDYPVRLKQCRDAPPVLYVYGSVPLLNEGQVGIVGSRNATAASVRLSRYLGQGLAGGGVTVTSGMARGIDSAAHAGALTGSGSTIAVLAGGLDIVYPPENDRLYQEICEKGAVLSEMPPGTEPKARQFLSRNRIIAGLSAGLVVVEAAARSGSLSTARMAGDYGREVMAIPGSPMDPRSKGTNKLLKDGAALVESAEDVLSLMGHILSFGVESGEDMFRSAPLTPADSAQIGEKDRQSVLSLLGPVPTEVDELLRQCQVSPADLHLILLELELAGRLVYSAGNRVALLPEGHSHRIETTGQEELF